MASNQNLAVKILINAQDNASSAFQKIQDNIGKLVLSFGIFKIAKFFKNVVDDASNFELQLDKVAAKGGYTASEMEKLTEFAQSVGTQFGKTGTESAAGLEILAAAGLNSTAAMQTLPSVLALAKSEGVSMDVAAANLTDTLSIMGLGFDQAGRAADVLTKGANLSNTSAIEMGQAFKYAGGSAKAAGYSLEETAAMIDVLAQSGIRGESAGTGLRNMLVQINDPTSKARVALEKLGIKTNDVSQIIDGLKKAGDAGKVAINEFGLVAGPTIYAMLLQGSAGIKNFTEELHKAGGASQETARVMGENFIGSQERLSAIWDALKSRLGTPILKPLSDSVDKLSNQFQTLLSTGVITNVGESIAAAFQTGADGFIEFVKKIDFSTIGKDIESFAISATQTFSTLSESAKTAGNIFDLATGVMGAGFNTIHSTILIAEAGIVGALGLMSKAIGATVVDFGYLTGLAPGMKNVGDSIIKVGADMRLSGEASISFAESLKNEAGKQLDDATASANKAQNGFKGLTTSVSETTPKLLEIWTETKKVVEANKEAAKTTTELATETKKTATERLQILKETHDKEVATLSQGTEERKKIDSDYLIASRKVYEDIAIIHNKSISEMSIAAQDHFNKSMAYTAAIVDAEKRKAAGIKEIEQAGMNDEQLRAEKRKEINKGISDYRKALAEGDLKKASEISKANEDLIKALAIEEATAAKNNHTGLSKTNELKNLYKQSVSDTKKAVEALQLTENSQSKSLELSIDTQNKALGTVKETITKIDESLKGDKQLKIDTSQADKSLKDTTTSISSIPNKETKITADTTQATQKVEELKQPTGSKHTVEADAVKAAQEIWNLKQPTGSVHTVETNTKSIKDARQEILNLPEMKKFSVDTDYSGILNALIKEEELPEKHNLEIKTNSDSVDKAQEKVDKLKLPTESTHTVIPNTLAAEQAKANLTTPTFSTHYINTAYTDNGNGTANVNGRTVYHPAGSNYWGDTPQFQNGGQIQYFSDGGTPKFIRREGKLSGYGGGDTVPAMLEPGEWIIKKEAVNKYGNGFMAQLNSMQIQDVPKFATGGTVLNRNMQTGGWDYDYQSWLMRAPRDELFTYPMPTWDPPTANLLAEHNRQAQIAIDLKTKQDEETKKQSAPEKIEQEKQRESEQQAADLYKQKEESFKLAGDDVGLENLRYEKEQQDLKGNDAALKQAELNNKEKLAQIEADKQKKAQQEREKLAEKAQQEAEKVAQEKQRESQQQAADLYKQKEEGFKLAGDDVGLENLRYEKEQQDLKGNDAALKQAALNNKEKLAQIEAEKQKKSQQEREKLAEKAQQEAEKAAQEKQRAEEKAQQAQNLVEEKSRQNAEKAAQEKQRAADKAQQERERAEEKARQDAEKSAQEKQQAQEKALQAAKTRQEQLDSLQDELDQMEGNILEIENRRFKKQIESLSGNSAAIELAQKIHTKKVESIQTQNPNITNQYNNQTVQTQSSSGHETILIKFQSPTHGEISGKFAKNDAKSIVEMLQAAASSGMPAKLH